MEVRQQIVDLKCKGVRHRYDFVSIEVYERFNDFLNLKRINRVNELI